MSLRSIVKNIEKFMNQNSIMYSKWFVFSVLMLTIIFTNSFFSSSSHQSYASVSASQSMNGFDLSYTLIDKSKILSGGPPKDGIPALTDPQITSADQASYLKPKDRVIGVELNGEARTYPINIIIWHELINDTVGGVPIVITYCPLCDSALVFHREIGGEIMEFGVSGLLYQSNVLMYNRQSKSNKESLWSQLAMKAVSGPAAQKGLEFALIDSELTTVQSWVANHPDTTILSKDTGYNRPYHRSAYENYFETDKLMFHVSGRTKRRPDLSNKDQIVLISVGEIQKAYVYKDIKNSTDQTILDNIGDAKLKIQIDPKTNVVNVTPIQSSISNSTINRAYMFWFAFDPFFPNVDVYNPNR